MQNNGTIPNVSTVFRQLIKISTTNPRLNNQTSSNEFGSTNNNFTYGNNTYQSNGMGNQRSFPSNMLENDRQQRHEALMGRLRYSVQENRQLLGIQESPMQRVSGSSYNINQRQQAPQISSFTTINNQFAYHDFSSYHQSSDPFMSNQPKQWVPPKIKYRHIQDLQQKQSFPKQNTVVKNSRNSSKKDIQISQQKNDQLKNEFYQNVVGFMDRSREQINNTRDHINNSRENNMERRQSKQVEGLHEEELQQYHGEQAEEENINKFSILSQKPPSKYNQNLQSYYDICRKPVKPFALTGKNNRNDQSKTNTQKFMRKQVPKVEGINLEKAMKILSLDD